MKILIISSNSNGSGGGEQYLVYLAKGLKARGHEVVILLSDKGYMDIWENRFKKEEIKTKRAKLTGLCERPLRFLGSIGDFRQKNLVTSICDKVKPDVIHVNQQYDADGIDYIMGAMKYGKVPIVSTIHMPMSLTKHPRPAGIRTLLTRMFFIDKMKTLFLRKWYKTHDYFKIFLTGAMKNEFTSVYGNGKYAELVTNGVDVSKITFSNHKKDIIGFCGRLDAQKDLFLLIEAWLNARKKGLPHKLLFVGDGVLRAKIENELKRKSPAGSWRITGWVDNPFDYLKDMALFVGTSIFEGCPFALLEAACAGRRCVCIEFPGASEIAERIPFLALINSRNPERLSEAIIENANRPEPDDETIKRVRDFFSCERMAKDTLSVYEKAVKTWKTQD